MGAKKRKKKKSRRRTGLLRAVILLIVLGIAGVAVWQIRGYFDGNATTARVVERSFGNYHSGTLVVARNETLYEAENATSIDFVADEGSRVSRAGVICKVYSSGYNQTEISRLQTYREEIQNYHVNQVFSTFVDAALDSENAEIDALALQVRSLVQGRGVGSLSNLERQMTSALTVRKNYLRQKYPDDQTLSELYKVENDQLKKIESWTTTYTAQEDCIVSFYTDGYEQTVNSTTYASLTPSDVRNVIRGVAPEQSTVSAEAIPSSARCWRMNGMRSSCARMRTGIPWWEKNTRCSWRDSIITWSQASSYPSRASAATCCCACGSPNQSVEPGAQHPHVQRDGGRFCVRLSCAHQRAVYD